MIPASPPSPAPAALLDGLASLEAWAIAPARPRRLLAHALEALAGSCGALGIHVEATLAPDTVIGGGWGSLARRPGRGPRSGVVMAPLRRGPFVPGVEVDGETAGTVWLDDPTGPVDAVVRVVEHALEAARGREEVARSVARLEALDEAIRAMTGVLAVDRVLQVIVDRVRTLTGARYAALGIQDASGAIEQFVTSGISRPDRARIGAPPQGHGILGLIIRENRTIRLEDLMADPRGVGFPPNHPEMHPFLGVPVVVRGRTIGNLYLTERAGGFTAEDDQRLVETFALHAGIAIENARLHEQVQRLAIVDERERIGKDLHDSDHPGDLRGRPLARGRPRPDGRGARRGSRAASSGRSTASTRRSVTSATSSSGCARSSSTARRSWRASPRSPTSSASTR